MTQNQKDIIRTIAVWLVGGLCTLFLIGLMLFYRAELAESQAQLQSVTNTLTEEREQHAQFVREQELIKSIVDAGRVAKQESEVFTSEAIKVQRTEGTAVYATGTSLDLLREASRKVRARALPAEQ